MSANSSLGDAPLGPPQWLNRIALTSRTDGGSNDLTTVMVDYFFGIAAAEEAVILMPQIVL
jgi:hypothetical protein